MFWHATKLSFFSCYHRSFSTNNFFIVGRGCKGVSTRQGASSSKKYTRVCCRKSKFAPSRRTRMRKMRRSKCYSLGSQHTIWHPPADPLLSATLLYRRSLATTKTPIRMSDARYDEIAHRKNRCNFLHSYHWHQGGRGGGYCCRAISIIVQKALNRGFSERCN